MKRYYSASTFGWYTEGVHATMPADCKEVSEAVYLSLLGKFVVPDANGMPSAQAVAAPTAASVREVIKAAVTAKRYEVECGGIVLLNGIRLDTAREDQAAIANTLAVLPCTGLGSIEFKAASGFVSLTLEELTQIAAAVGRHKQACYSAERVHHAALDARSTIDYLNEYDYSTGWPPNA